MSVFACVMSVLVCQKCVCVFLELTPYCSRLVLTKTLDRHDQVVTSGASDNSAWAILGKRRIGDEG